MSEKETPPAPPAEADTSATAPEHGEADQGATQPDEAKPAEETEGKKPEPLSHRVRAHLAEANHPDATDRHPTVAEHAAIRSLEPVRVVNPETGLRSLVRHHWQIRAVLARFRAEGLREDARISNELFEQALHEALHGRI